MKGMKAAARTAALGTLLTGVAGCTNSCQPRLRKVYTEHLGQLTGTVQNPIEQWAFSGTDLGVSFTEPASSRRLIFLFGDSWTRTGARWDEDAVGWTQFFVRPERNKLPKMFFFGSDQFEAVRIPGVDLGGMNVPVEGLGANGRIYVFAVTGWDTERHCCSVLAHTEGLAPEFNPLILDHKVASDRFLNVSAIVEGGTVWLFGSGPYRKSSVYLARVQANEIGDRAKWTYHRGGGSQDFGPDEDTAHPIVASRCVGELSVRKHPQLGYLMLYNCGAEGAAQRGIHLRRADNPWGPWEPAINIFDPGPDHGYGYFIHRKFGDFTDGNGARVVGPHVDDGLAEPGRHANPANQVCKPEHQGCCGSGWREECMGGEYGPYLVPEWFSTTADGGFSIVYTLSTWVPYQAHLMRTILAWRDDPRPVAPQRQIGNLPPAHLVNPDFADGLHGWQGLGDPFVTFSRQGRSYVTTYTPAKRDAAMGALFQDFTVDASTKALRFLVHGGDGTVRLHRGHEIVRETRGRSGHEPRNEPDTVVCWQLGEYAGETLRVAIFDGQTGPWGFIGVTGFQFLAAPC